MSTSCICNLPFFEYLYCTTFSPSLQIKPGNAANICNFIATTLRTHDYKVSFAGNAANGLSLAVSGCPDLILLDLGLPDIDSIVVIRTLREWSNIPIIVISARTQEKEKVAALDAGADDYITKPFGTSDMMARVRTALRRSALTGPTAVSAQNRYMAKDLVIDYEKHIISIDGNIIHFTQIGYKILTFLAHNAGKVITYDTLITHVWGSTRTATTASCVSTWPTSAESWNKTLRIRSIFSRKSESDTE